ncbi:MAG TPA: phage terminase large subunit [Candidatus Saccharibacteria bacterium]|nr:phage terminase large subunit [Candidatus Saccharibacteria bacterium]
MENKLSDLEWDKIRKDSAVRQTIGGNSFYWFFHLYFSHYIEFATADFQKEMFQLASDDEVEHLIVLAFRSSGKSTIITTALPLWAVMGSMQKKYVVIVSQTQSQAQQHLKNIANEIETNELIAKDFFPYQEETNETGISAINLPKFNARIIAVSREQGVRGLRSGQHRPDLIIADDVEDTNSVKTRESRHKTFDWFTGELIPLGSEKTKFITVGNLLHEDSLIMRLKAGIEDGTRSGTFVEYPLVNKNGTPLWLDRFPDKPAVERLKKRVANPITWEREYMLHLVADDEQIITRKMLHHYPEIPMRLRDEFQRTFVGVDLAISERDKADYTAIVTFRARGTGSKRRIYVLPNPINKRMSFPNTITTLKDLHNSYGCNPKLYVEQVGYQAAVVQQLEIEGLDVSGITPNGDKRARLSMVAHMITSGEVLFPEIGCERLIEQLVGFGVEKHDDLVDAFTMALLAFKSTSSDNQPSIQFLPRKEWDRMTGRTRRSFWGSDSGFGSGGGWTRLMG